ncbi:MAG TPA: protein translocase subunit SecF [Gammaproteobacteria bacterium]|nr:protein translocase subunit SecF [Gammaproteobacteria bacterium]
MEFFKKKTEIDFMGLRKWTAILSIVLFSCALVTLVTKGLNWGLDFTGGTQVQISYPQPANLIQVREQLNQAGFHEAVVQSYGTSKQALISVAPKVGEGQREIKAEIISALPGASIERMEYVGPQVGKEMETKGFLAILIALLGTMMYIAIRFEYRFAIGSSVALIHDPVLILGLFSFFHWDFNLNVLAAVLAVIGYSLNDTIVIFDRIRENFRKLRKGSPVEVVNLSINQTLSRTIMTSATTLVVVLSLFIYGGNMIHGFALALMIGIVVGTYSSIYVAGALAVALGLNREDLMPTVKGAIDDRP